MADSTVHITGTDSGAFKDAFDKMPAWATEDTLSTIHGILVKSLKVHQDSFKELTKILKKSTGSGGSGGSDPDLKKLVDGLNKDRANADKFKKDLENAGNAANARADADKKGASQSGAWSTILGGLTGLGNKALGIQEQYIKTSGDLFNSGINLVAGQQAGVTSMQSLNQMVALTGIRLENLQKVVQKYSESINAVGITKFTKTLARSSADLVKLGYSSEEQAEMFGLMMESQSSYSDLRNKSEQELADGAVRFGQQLNKITLQTGQSRTAVMQNIKALSENSDSMVIAAIAGEKAATRVNEFATSFKNSNVQNMIQRFAAATDVAQDSMYQSLVKATGGPQAAQFAEVATQLRDGMITEVEARAKMIDIASKLSDADIQALQRQKLAGNVDAAPALDMLNALRSAGYKTSQATDDQADAAVNGKAAIAGFAKEVERGKALLQAAFPALETTLNSLTGIIKAANDKLMPVAAASGSSGVGNIASSMAIIAGFASAVGATIWSLRKFTNAIDVLINLANNNSGGGHGGRGGGRGGRGGGRGGRGGGRGGGPGPRPGTVRPMAGPMALVGLAGGYALDKAGEHANESGHEKTAAGLDTASAALQGASYGSMIGMLGGPVGMAIGAVAGGVLGAAVGAYSNKDTLFGNTKDPKQTEIDNKVVEDEKEKLDEQSKSTISSTPSPATTDKATGTDGINTMMAQQVRILNDILASSTRLVSINNEILRVSRTH